MKENSWVKIKAAEQSKSKGCAWKQRKIKDFCSTSRQQTMSSHFPGSRASVHAAVALEDK